MLRIANIEAKTLPEAWFLSLKEVLSHGYEYRIDRGSYEGQMRKELDYVVIHIEYPNCRPLAPDTPVGIPAPVTQEYIDGYLPYLMTSHKAKNEQYTYGEDLECQIPEVIKMYREDGYNTNQAYMAVGSSQSIFLRDPQCLRGIDTRIRYGKLHFMVYFRSEPLKWTPPATSNALAIAGSGLKEMEC